RDEEGRSMAAVPKAGLQLFSLRDVLVIDREAERDRLWTALQTVHRGGDPKLVLLEGDAGTGKTRLAQWLCRRAHETGAAVVLRASHTDSSGPDAGLREMIRRIYQTVGLSRGEIFERLAKQLPSLGSDDTMRLTDTRGLTELLRPTGSTCRRWLPTITANSSTVSSISPPTSRTGWPNAPKAIRCSSSNCCAIGSSGTSSSPAIADSNAATTAISICPTISTNCGSSGSIGSFVRSLPETATTSDRRSNSRPHSDARSTRTNGTPSSMPPAFPVPTASWTPSSNEG
ncbi:MAG: AAA family ATPase, partial [Bradymonadaceae bacterium]